VIRRHVDGRRGDREEYRWNALGTTMLTAARSIILPCIRAATGL
jgi:hypothetical protein